MANTFKNKDKIKSGLFIYSKLKAPFVIETETLGFDARVAVQEKVPVIVPAAGLIAVILIFPSEPEYTDAPSVYPTL